MLVDDRRRAAAPAARRAADADERQFLDAAVALEDLVRDPRQRPRPSGRRPLRQARRRPTQNLVNLSESGNWANCERCVERTRTCRHEHLFAASRTALKSRGQYTRKSEQIATIAALAHRSYVGMNVIGRSSVNAG